MSRRRSIILLGCLIYVIQIVYLVSVQIMSDDNLGGLGIVLTVALCLVFALVDAGVTRYLITALQNIERAQANSMDEQLKESLQSYREAMRIEEQAVCDLAQELEAELERARTALGSESTELMDEHLRRSLGIVSGMAATPCNNVTVAAVLDAKARQCREAGIVLDAHVSLPQDLAISAMDVASIFFNLIDNARHECEVLVSQGAVNPVITVRSILQAGQLFVEVENPCRTDAESRRRKVRAPIDTSRLHGWGTGIVEGIAHKHGGVASMEAKGDHFVAQVMVPVAAS